MQKCIRYLYAQNTGGVYLRKTKAAQAASPEDVRIQTFLDMIAPSVIKFETDHFICGNTYRCVWALREYPTARMSRQSCPIWGRRTVLPCGFILAM